MTRHPELSWLEDPASPAIVEWMSERLTESTLQLAEARTRTSLAIDRQELTAPQARLSKTRSGHEFSLVADAASGRNRVWLDRAPLSPEGQDVQAWNPSPDGSFLLIACKIASSELLLISVVVVATGEVLQGLPPMACRIPETAWNIDSSGFYYIDEGEPGRESHRLAKRCSLENGELSLFDPDHPMPMRTIRNSPDGRWTIAVATANGQDMVWLRSAIDPMRELELVAAAAAGAIADADFSSDSEISIVTTIRDDHGEILIAMPCDEPGRSLEWERLVEGQATEVIRHCAWGSAHGEAVALVLTTVHGASELLLVTKSTKRRVDVRLPIEGPYAVHGIEWAECSRGNFRVLASSPCNPPSVFSVDPTGADLGLTPDKSSSPAELRTVHRSFRASDGTDVWMYLTRATDSPEPAPTAVNVYGGFGLSIPPAFSAAVRTWVRAGGVWATVLVRGGGEEGPNWHEAGRRENKTRSRDDLAEAIDFLVDTGVADPARIGLYGESHGALLAASEAARHPDRYAALVCAAPLADLEAFSRSWPGSTWISELGDPDEPADAIVLNDLDPFNITTPIRSVPSVLVSVGEHDQRVPPWHGKKLVECWLAVRTASDRSPCLSPMILRWDRGSGHVWNSVNEAADRAVDELAFLSVALGLTDGNQVNAGGL